MTRRRTSVFLIAAAAMAAAATLLVALPDRPSRPPDVPRGARLQPVPRQAPAAEHAPEPLPHGTEPPNPVAGARQRRHALGVAERFLRAFLRYQTGYVDPWTRAALRHTATPALAQTLLRRPPRAARSGSSPARLGPLAVNGPFGGRLKVSARLDYPGTGASLLELALQRRGDVLRVSRLYP